jgi:cellulase/cellobiase CelA1
MNRLQSFAAICMAATTQAYSLDQQLPRSTVNPFSRTTNYYVNPVFKTELQSSIDTCEAGAVKTYLQSMMNSPSSYWIDRKSVIGGTGTTKTMEGILADAAASG